MTVCVRLGDSLVANRPLDKDGWILANNSFTLLSQRLSYSSVCVTAVISPVSCALQQLLLMDHSEHHPQFYVRQHLRMPCGHLQKCFSAECMGPQEPSRCMNAYLSKRKNVQFHLQLCSLWRQGLFFKNNCWITSAEMWPHAARAHHKWFLSAGGYLFAPVCCSFLPQTAS